MEAKSLVAIARQGPRTAGFIEDIKSALSDHSGFIFLVVFYMALVFLIAGSAGLEDRFKIGLYQQPVFLSYGVAGFVIALLYFTRLIFVRRPRRPLTQMAMDALSLLADGRRITSILIPLILIPVFVSAFTSFKSLIGDLNPFAYDQVFALWDRALHFGIDPWKITHAVFSTARSTAVINLLYHLWFFVMWGFLLWHIFNTGIQRKRLQFLLTYVLLWIIVGSFSALALSSAGPVYYGGVTGLEDPFSPLMHKLYAAHSSLLAENSFWKLWALDLQTALWEQHLDKTATIGGGISAMPSMHVAISTLLALTGFKTSRLFGWVMTAFAAAILIGSVHLGWHYAIDGYVSIILTLMVWKAVSFYLDYKEAKANIMGLA